MDKGDKMKVVATRHGGGGCAALLLCPPKKTLFRSFGGGSRTAGAAQRRQQATNVCMSQRGLIKCTEYPDDVPPVAYDTCGWW